MTEQENKPLLPDFVKKPSIVLWTMFLPQIILFLINGWTLWLVSGEASTQNLSIFGGLFAAQVALLMLASGAWYSAWKQKACICWPWFLALFLGQIGFLWFFVTNLWQVIPRNVDRWIVDEGMLSFYAFSLMMPGIFYSGMQLACFELPISRRKNFGPSIFLTILAPAAFYLFFLSSRMMRTGGQFFYMFLWPLFFIGLTVVTFVGLIRLMVLLYNWISERGDLGQMLFAIIVGIAGPIGGLALNRTMPFPADFQSFAVYIMAIVNGVIVLLPRIKRFENGLLFLRTSSYPFSFYFFLVFLPFLPLALPAIFALGVGFLFLVPVLLFILHTKKVADDFKECVSKSGVKVAVFLIVLGISILPVYFIWQAYSDKGAVKQALQYVYSPNYEAEQSFKGDLKATKRVLLNLKRFKEGIQLPYISDFYNRIVFEEMVLPDKKIANMYRIFTGEDIERIANGAGWQMGRGRGFGFTRGRMRGVGGGRLRQIDRNVALESFQVQVMDEGEYKRSKLHLVMRNTGSSNESEFLTDISVPPGVIITGFQLLVDKVMVPGQIFERRTAQWVYHMIRDFVRRDPGLLSYKTPVQIELSIYPFTQGETRETEIVFEYPANFAPVVQIGDKTIALSGNEAASSKETYSVNDVKGNAFLFVPEEQVKLLPKFKRQPYLYFILDRSQNGLQNLSGYAKQIEAVAVRYPQAKKCRITAANFSIENVAGILGPSQGDMVRIALQKIALKRQGGLDFERVIRTELLRYARQSRQPSNAADWQTYPLFVVITSNKASIEELKDLEFYRDIIPEGGLYLVVSSGNDMEQRSLWGKPNAVEPAEVIVLSHGKRVSLLSAYATNGQVATFFDVSRQKTVPNDFLVFDAGQNQFIPLGAVKSFSDLEFLNKVSLLWTDKQAILNPSIIETSLPDLVKESRRLSLLIPSTSFIVVERSVQWKALKITEKKRLSTAGAFEFEEEFKTPAPSFWVLLIILALLLIFKQRSKF